MEVPLRALELLSDEIYDDMSSISPGTEEWCVLAEKFIELNREINKRTEARDEKLSSEDAPTE